MAMFTNCAVDSTVHTRTGKLVHTCTTSILIALSYTLSLAMRIESRSKGQENNNIEGHAYVYVCRMKEHARAGRMESNVNTAEGQEEERTERTERTERAGCTERAGSTGRAGRTERTGGQREQREQGGQREHREQ